jgi:NTE family protein
MSLFRRIGSSLRAFKREIERVPVIPPAVSPQKRPSIGIALGGGFARGLAHIGVLKVLEENNIPIDYIAGTSVGAVIGAAYASGVSGKELAEIAALVRFKDIGRYTISRYGLCSNDRLVGLLERVLRVRTFEELRIPLAVTATDFVSGEPVIFRKGDLIDPVRASCAYPGVFTPVQVNGRLMVDGLLAHSVPAKPLRKMGAEKVIAIYFTAHWVKQGGPKHVLDVIGQCFSIAQANMACLWQAEADLLIEPDVAPFSFDAFERAADIIHTGEEAARVALPAIKAWLPEEAPAQTLKPAPTAQPSPVQLA